MNENKTAQQVKRAMTHALAGLQEDEYMTQRVIAQEKQERKRNIPGKRLIAVLVAVCLMLTAGAGLAWSLSRDYFREIAQITLTSGDYESWSLQENEAYEDRIFEK